MQTSQEIEQTIIRAIRFHADEVEKLQRMLDAIRDGAKVAKHGDKKKSHGKAKFILALVPGLPGLRAREIS